MKEIKKKVEMMANNMLVYVDIPDTTTESGIMVSEDVARDMHKDVTGEILVVGPDVKLFSVGDTILLPPHGSTVVSINNEAFHVFRETSIFGKLK
tara:strand:+ start:156 stop:440 length:285 start_codon:yes stop_codon:yes gene_type:complete